MSDPLVSIVTPVLNGSRFIKSCLESVTGQSYNAIEHVIVDGGSTDGTIETILQYVAEHQGRIKFIVQRDARPGAGPGPAWNRGLKEANGHIIGWLGSDDMLSDRDSIASVVGFFKVNPEAYFVHGACQYIDENGTILSRHSTRDVMLTELINEGNPIACPSSFYRREVVDTVGPLDSYGNDLDYVIRIAKAFRLYRIDRVLSSFRVHPDSQTGSLYSYVKVCRKDYLVSRKHGGRFLSGYRKRFYISLARVLLGPLFPYVRNAARAAIPKKA